LAGFGKEETEVVPRQLRRRPLACPGLRCLSDGLSPAERKGVTPPAPRRRRGCAALGLRSAAASWGARPRA
jgi:hypothetical protein